MNLHCIPTPFSSLPPLHFFCLHLPLLPWLSFLLSVTLLHSLSGINWQVQQRRSRLPCLCETFGSACWCVPSGAVSSWGWTLALDMAVSWQFSPPLVSDHKWRWTHVYAVSIPYKRHIYISLSTYICIHNTWHCNYTLLIWKVTSSLLFLFGKLLTLKCLKSQEGSRVWEAAALGWMMQVDSKHRLILCYCNHLKGLRRTHRFKMCYLTVNSVSTFAYVLRSDWYVTSWILFS